MAVDYLATLSEVSFQHGGPAGNQIWVVLTTLASRILGTASPTKEVRKVVGGR